MVNILLPRQETHDDAWADFKLWYYSPSIPAAVIFSILFIGLTSYHTYLLVRRRTWFCIPFVVGGVLESIGYVVRIVAHSNTENVTMYAMQSLCLLLAPILFAASVYMILGRIIRAVHAEHHSLIRVTWLTKIFVGGDIFCFAIQGAGGGMLSGASTKSAVDTANNIVLGGLILQIVIFCVFAVVAVLFQIRLGQAPTDSTVNGPLGNHSTIGGVRGWVPARSLPGWKRLMIGLYLTSALITIRNLVRVIEYAMGWNSYLFAHEWTLYVFDGLMMVAVLVIGIMWYDPAISKNNASRKIVAEDEMTSLENGRSTQQTKEVTRSEGQNVGPWS